MTRITKLKKTKTKVEPLKENELNSLDSFYGGSYTNGKDLLDYEIIASKIVATYFEEREIHSSQKVIKQDEDTYKITFKLPDSYEVVRVLAGFYNEIYEVSPKVVLDQLEEITNKQ